MEPEGPQHPSTGPVLNQINLVSDINQTGIITRIIANTKLLWEPPTLNKALANHSLGTISC
jgi:hypothetical protein